MAHFIQDAQGCSASVVNTLSTASISVTAGNFLIAYAWMNGQTPNTPTTNQGDTFTLIGSSTSTHLYAWYCASAVGGSTALTVTTGGGSNYQVYLAEYSGLSSTIVAHGGGVSGDPGSLSVSTVPSMLFACCMNNGGSGVAPTLPSGFTARSANLWTCNTPFTLDTIGDKRVTSAGSVDPAFTGSATDVIAFAVAESTGVWTFGDSGAIARATSTNVTPLSVAYPTQLIAGDILILAVAQTSTAGKTFSVSDAGFTSRVFSNLALDVGIYTKTATGSETGTFTVASTSSDDVYAVCTRWGGGSETVSGTSANKHNSGSASIFWPAMTVPDNNALVLALGAGFFGSGVSGNFDQPTPWKGTLATSHNAGLDDVFGFEYVIQTTATNIGTGNWSPSVTGTGVYETVLVALQVAAVGGGGGGGSFRRSSLGTRTGSRQAQ